MHNVSKWLLGVQGQKYWCIWIYEVPWLRPLAITHCLKWTQLIFPSSNYQRFAGTFTLLSSKVKAVWLAFLWEERDSSEITGTNEMARMRTMDFWGPEGEVFLPKNKKYRSRSPTEEPHFLRGAFIWLLIVRSISFFGEPVHQKIVLIRTGHK